MNPRPKHREKLLMRTHTAINFTKTILLISLFLMISGSAAAQSMIPEDFDWSVYLQDWDNSWMDDWGEPDPMAGTGGEYTGPIFYDWYGQTYEIDNGWYPTEVPIPQFDTNSGIGSSSYVPAPVYPEQQQGWGEGSWNQPQYSNGDQWFYQQDDGVFYDEFGSWNGSAPASAFVSGFNGLAQSYNLDCEARSAVDLAAYFGVNISHSEFLNRLPRSDDPNEGFVGNYTDSRGKIPPSSYGVYQEPVAALLRDYGLPAIGVYAYTADALKSQIANGKPVMVWVVGNTEIGYSVPYTAASNGRTTYVAPYQHTVVVIGYDSNSVTIQDGGMKYSRDWQTFKLSWGALGNRAIYVN